MQETVISIYLFIYTIYFFNQDIKIDWTLNISTLIHLIGVIIAITAGYYKLKQKQDNIENKVNIIYGWWQRRMEMLENEEREKERKTRRNI